MMFRRIIFTYVTALVVLTGCGSGDPTGEEVGTTSPPTTQDQPAAINEPVVIEEQAGDSYPDVIGAEATGEGNGSWRVDVTISSPYDSPERYADAWRVLGPDGTEYGIRVLTHDHASEQPFTRSQSGIEIPEDVTTVTIEGRDLANGWGGQTFELELPGA